MLIDSDLGVILVIIFTCNILNILNIFIKKVYNNSVMDIFNEIINCT